jgi:hypothetical protein
MTESGTEKTFFENFQQISKAILTPTIALYFFGFITMSSYLGRFGFVTFDVVNSRFLIAGIIPSLALGMSIYLATIFKNNIKKKNIFGILRKSGNWRSRYEFYIKFLGLFMVASTSLTVLVSGFGYSFDPKKSEFPIIFPKFMVSIAPRLLDLTNIFSKHPSANYVFSEIIFVILTVFALYFVIYLFIERIKFAIFFSKVLTYISGNRRRIAEQEMQSDAVGDVVASQINNNITHTTKQDNAISPSYSERQLKELTRRCALIGEGRTESQIREVAESVLFSQPESIYLLHIMKIIEISIPIIVIAIFIWCNLELLAYASDLSHISANEKIRGGLIFAWVFSSTFTIYIAFIIFCDDETPIKFSSFQKLNIHMMPHILMNAVIPIILSVMTFGGSIFSYIPSAFGGGQPRQVTLTWKDSGRREVVLLLEESSQYLFTIRREGSTPVATQISKEQISSIEMKRLQSGDQHPGISPSKSDTGLVEISF